MFLSTLARRFALTIEPLCAAIARHARRCHAAIPLVAIAHGRLRRLLGRLDRLAARFEAGRLRPARRRDRPAAAAPVRLRVQAPGGLGGLGWLTRLAPEARQLGPQVAALVADPATLALVAAAPQAGRLLRPLCRMMGIRPPDGLALPRRVRAARPRPAAEAPEAAVRPGGRGLAGVPWRLRLVVPGLRRPLPGDAVRIAPRRRCRTG